MERFTRKSSTGVNFILCTHVRKVFSDKVLDHIIEGEAVDRLAEYEDLEEQNRLLKLPCAIRDTIYIILHNNVIEEKVVIGFKLRPKGWAVEVSDWCYLFEDFGKRVFLNKEEAVEAAFRMMNERIR